MTTRSSGLPYRFWILKKRAKAYALAAVILIVAGRLGIGIKLINLRADIEKKALSTIGFVAGVLAAIVYWIVEVVYRLGSLMLRRT